MNVSILEHDAFSLVGSTVTIPIAKTSRRTVYRECLVWDFYPLEGIWKAKDVHTHEFHFFDLIDIVNSKVHFVSP
jgi:hypothetical protein